MRDGTPNRLAMAAVTAVVFGVVGCTGGSRPTPESDAGSAAGAELASAATESEQPEAESADGTGEHGEGREGTSEHARSEGGGEHGEGREGAGEHGRAEGGGEHGEASERGEHGAGEEGEESDDMIGRSDTWDVTRRGARLVLAFDAESNAFAGTVENTTQQTMCAVRVEVHLSTGTELGPTERTNLPTGETLSVELGTDGEGFDQWTAHPEMSRCSEG